MIHLSALPPRGDREAPLTRQELRALRQLAAAAPELLRLLAHSKVGSEMCPTWRRIQTESSRRACEG